MKIGVPFNTLTAEEYFFCIDHHKKYTDFNTLGLYRSIAENDKLLPEDSIRVRDNAHGAFSKTFDFLQLKDPQTCIAVEYPGTTRAKGDVPEIWRQIKIARQKILEEKKPGHRNFGAYAKHNCGFADCPPDGIIVRQGTSLAERTMHFDSDRNPHPAKAKSAGRKRDRKQVSKIILGKLKNG
jgi:hypothetical protein